MRESPTLEVNKCTSADYERILRTLLNRISPTHRQLLTHHYEAREHAASTKELSEAMGWRGDAANMHYGGLAALLDPFILRPKKSNKLYLIACFEDAQERWVLRPEFIEASRRVGLL